MNNYLEGDWLPLRTNKEQESCEVADELTRETLVKLADKHVCAYKPAIAAVICDEGVFTLFKNATSIDRAGDGENIQVTLMGRIDIPLLIPLKNIKGIIGIPPVLHYEDICVSYIKNTGRDINWVEDHVYDELQESGRRRELSNIDDLIKSEGKGDRPWWKSKKKYIEELLEKRRVVVDRYNRDGLHALTMREYRDNDIAEYQLTVDVYRAWFKELVQFPPEVIKGVSENVV